MDGIRGSRRWGANLALVGALAFAMAPGLFALDLNGRTDTGYRLDVGDGNLVNRVWNTHSLDFGISDSLKFSMYGGIRGAFGAPSNVGSVTLGLADTAVKSGMSIDYDLYSASFSYSSDFFGASAGRFGNQAGAMASFDGISAWVAPLTWLRVDIFGGFPWTNASLLDAATAIPDAISAGALEGGANLNASLLEGKLNLVGGYTYLAQNTATSGTLAAPSDLRTDQILRISATFAPGEWLSAGASGNLVNFAPLGATLWAGGLVEAAHLSYSVNGDLQFVDAAKLGNSLADFAAILGASDSYLAASVALSEDLGAFVLPKGGFVSSLSLDAGFDHRQPLSGSATANNPGYEQFRVGPALGFAFGLGLSGYYNYLFPAPGFGSATNAFGGEISQKIDAFDIRLGSSFTANKWERDVSGTTYSDSFGAQQYYARAKWKVTKAFDLQLRASYETFEQQSITDAFTGITDLNADPRSLIRAELRAGYRY